MASQSPPDTDYPGGTPQEMPPDSPPAEAPQQEPPGFDQPAPDYDQPDTGPIETPPPPDLSIGRAGRLTGRGPPD